MRRLPFGLTILLLTGVTFGQAPTGATYERQIVTAGPGPQRLAIDAALLSAGSPFRVLRRGDTYYAEDGLGDLRLVDGDGRPVPYLVMQPPPAERQWIVGRVIPIAPTKKTSGFEVDLGEAREIDMLRVGGLPAPYLKRLSIEASGNREHWVELAPEATLFDLPDEKLRKDTHAFAPGPYRYLRITWNDTNSGRVSLPAQVGARLVESTPAPPPMTIQTSIEKRPSEPGRSRFRVRLPAAGLPIVALDLDVVGGHVYRTAWLTEARFSGLEAAPVELGRATLARVTRDGATASALRIPIASAAEAEIDLTIDDGTNEPLDVRGAAVVLAQLPWIYFEAPSGAVTARYGDRTLKRPSYDLEAARGSIKLATLKQASWSVAAAAATPVETAAPAATVPQPGPVLDAAAFAHVRSVQGSDTGLVALPLDAHVLAFSRGPASRFADVRVLGADNRQLPFLVERRDEPLSLELPVAPVKESQVPELKSSGSRQRSIYAVTLPYARLPPGKLVIETSARVFQRAVRVGVEHAPDRNRRDAWFETRAAETWRHADEATPARPLTFSLDNSADTDVRLIVDEGDNAPLPITAVKLLLPSYRLRFYAPSEGRDTIRLSYGREDLQPAQYDLALLAPRVMGSPAAEVSTAAPSAAVPAATSTFVSPRTFWVVLGIAVLVLLALIARLLRSTGDQPAA